MDFLADLKWRQQILITMSCPEVVSQLWQHSGYAITNVDYVNLISEKI